MYAALARSVPAVIGARTRCAGPRPLSPDGLPIIGAVPAHPSVLVATGHGMMGMTLPPVTGVLVRDLVEGGEPRAELCVQRFAR
jgi:D-amino-acid dehydrogenase